MKELVKRLYKLETATTHDLPPVVCLDGTLGSPRLWNRGVTRVEAVAINASMETLLRLLGLHDVTEGE